MKNDYIYVFISLFIVFVAGSVSLAADRPAKSLINFEAPTDLENIKVFKLSTDKNSSNFLIFIKKSVPPHRHLIHSESIYVLSGEANFTLGKRTFKIAKGDFINVPERTIHSVVVTSEKPLKVLSNQAPEFLGKDRVAVK